MCSSAYAFPAVPYPSRGRPWGTWGVSSLVGHVPADVQAADLVPPAHPPVEEPVYAAEALLGRLEAPADQPGAVMLRFRESIFHRPSLSSPNQN